MQEIDRMIFVGGSIVISDDGALSLYLDKKERINADRTDVMRIGVYLLLNVSHNKNCAIAWLMEQGGLQQQHAENVVALFNEWGGDFTDLLDAARML